MTGCYFRLPAFAPISNAPQRSADDLHKVTLQLANTDYHKFSFPKYLTLACCRHDHE